jgi:hypothetical protein
MSTIIFPGINWDAPEDPKQAWMYELCSQCDRVSRGHPGADEPSDKCGCIPDNPATILLLVDNREEVWQRLTEAGVPDRVMSRVWRLMCGREEY